MNLTVNEVRLLAHQAMIAAGYRTAEAGIIADHLLDCELRGLGFGGLARALSIVEQRADRPHPSRPISVIEETASSASIDGADHVGYLVAKQATDLAINKASTTGVSVVGARRTWYTGMFSYYLEMITAAGLMGMIAGSGLQIVAPHGATEGRFGTNPIAFGFPSVEQPVIWDIGTSAVMLGEVMLRERLGEPLAPAQAYAPTGEPTQNPTEALKGAFAVWGGHKGSGLALTVQLLGMMAGASADPDGLEDCGLFIVAIDPDISGADGQFRERVAEYSQSVRAARPQNPSQPVRMPFDRSAAERERRWQADSIDIDDRVLQQLRAFVGASPL